MIGAMLLSVLTGRAQTSPYTGVAPDEIVSGNDYFLYNVESGLWLQNNDRKANDWHTRGQLGVRGLDFQLNASGDGYLINAKFGRKSLNRDNYYLDANDDHVWVFEAKAGSVSNAVTIKSGTKYLVADSYTAGNGYNNQYNAGTPGQNQWYLNNPDNNSNNGTWQIVTKEERLAVMLEAGKTVEQDATWLVGSPDFANNDTRFSKWTKVGEWPRGGDADGDWGRGSMIMEAWNKPASNKMTQTVSLPNGVYSFTLQGFYRDGGTAGIGAKHNAGTETIRAKYFAGDVERDLRSVIDGHTSAVVGPDRWRVETSGWYVPDNMADCSRCMNIDFGYPNEAIEVTVNTGQLTIGVKKTGAADGDWVIFDNIKLTYLGPIDLSAYLAGFNKALEDAKNFDGETTDALQQALDDAIAAAEAIDLDNTNADELGDATSALVNAYNNVVAANTAVLRPTVALAKAEGINVATQEDYLVNGTTNRVDEYLRLVRNLRKLNAIEKVDITKIECSEPTNVEADYYLYNVGAGIFFSTTADWGCHIAIDNPGMLIHFRPDGEWDGAPGRPVFHLSGNGWDGMNWQEEYWDKDGVNKLAFVPVEGKDKVYNMCEWDNYNWHFVYDPAEDVCDGNTHYWNAVQKRDWNRADYVNNPYAQWMLVSPAAYKAAMEKATEDSKLDVTFLIENPNFTKAKVDGNDNWTRGWTGVGDEMRGEGREPWMVIEWFERSANMKQIIHNLPAGKYEVSCYGFYRDGNSDNEAGKVLKGETLRQDAYLVANDAQVALPNVTSAAGMMPGIGEPHGLSEDFACWPRQANEYFQTGLYKATVPVEVGADGELTIGVEYEHTTGTDGSWVVVGNFRLTCVELIHKVNVTIGSADYTTFVAPFDIAQLPDGVEAYAAQVNDEKSSVHLEKIDAIPAGEAVVLKNVGEGEYTMVQSKTAVSALNVKNDLLPSDGTVIGDQSTIFGLAMKNGVVGFYLAKSGVAVPEGKGYLKIENSANAARGYIFSFDEEEETGINGVEDIETIDQSIYNLAGQRIQKTQKGVNIVNGKKVIF